VQPCLEVEEEGAGKAADKDEEAGLVAREVPMLLVPSANASARNVGIRNHILPVNLASTGSALNAARR
jgi:hypothetical protein